MLNLASTGDGQTNGLPPMIQCSTVPEVDRTVSGVAYEYVFYMSISIEGAWSLTTQLMHISLNSKGCIGHGGRRGGIWKEWKIVISCVKLSKNKIHLSYQ